MHVVSLLGPAMQPGDWCLVDDEGEELFGFIQDVNLDLGVVFLIPEPGCISGAPFLLREVKKLAIEVPPLGESDMLTLMSHFSSDN